MIGGRGRTRTYEAVKQGIYSPPPLPLGTLSPDHSNASEAVRLGSEALYAAPILLSQALAGPVILQTEMARPKPKLLQNAGVDTSR